MNLLSYVLESGSVIDKLQGYTATSDQTIAQRQLSDPDYWSSVGIIALTGILVVFLILAILIFFFWLMGTIFKAVDKSKKAKQEASKAAETVKEPVAAAVAKEAPAEELSDDGELVAVITAAIAAYTDEEFTIKSIKKSAKQRQRSAWSAAGIGENTRPFSF